MLKDDNKHLRIRKILVWISLFLISLHFVFSYLKYKELGLISKDYFFNLGYYSLILKVIFYGIWYIFIFIYLYSSDLKVRCRKWPYIVLIVFFSLGALYSIIDIFTIYGISQFGYLVSDFKIFTIIIFIIQIPLIVLISFCLSEIAKEKKDSLDFRYSQIVLDTAKNIEVNQRNGNQKSSDDLQQS